MAKSKLFIVYDSKNIGGDDVIPKERFIRNSKKHDSNYIVILVQNRLDNSLIRQIILEIYKPEFFKLLQKTILHRDYKIHLKETSVPESSDNFVYTRIVCEFEPGSFSGWIDEIEETKTYNDLNNIL